MSDSDSSGIRSVSDVPDSSDSDAELIQLTNALKSKSVEVIADDKKVLEKRATRSTDASSHNSDDESHADDENDEKASGSESDNEQEKVDSKEDDAVSVASQSNSAQQIDEQKEKVVEHERIDDSDSDGSSIVMPCQKIIGYTSSEEEPAQEESVASASVASKVASTPKKVSILDIESSDDDLNDDLNLDQQEEEPEAVSHLSEREQREQRAKRCIHKFDKK